MYSLEAINTEIKHHEEKIEILKKEKFKIKFIDLLNICPCSMENLVVEAEYNWTSNALDEYGHSLTAKLRVTYNEKEKLIIDYKEEQGEGTENGRYDPTIDFNIDCSKGARHDIIGETEERDDEEWRDLIKKIAAK